jgi:hypothetical protein
MIAKITQNLAIWFLMAILWSQEVLLVLLPTFALVLLLWLNMRRIF